MERGYQRSSVRSRGSSSTSDIAPREKIIDCCRKLVAFMCTQVGVGGLVVGYTVVGAFTFQYIETMKESPVLAQVNDRRTEYASILWNIISEQNIFNESAFHSDVDRTLEAYQEQMVLSIKKGYDGRTVKDVWSIPAALMFSLSIITMIGYGNMVPRTSIGKGVTVLYAVFGIPLYILYFMNMGEVLAGTFRWVYTWLYECSTERDENEPPRRVIVPSSASLWVISGYIATGAILFAEWEQWSYLDSTYFCVTSLCKIGLGDFVPGANINDFKVGSQTKLVVNFVYMLVGLGLVAMCYNLMREEVRVKVKEMKEDMDVKHCSMLGAPLPAFPLRLCGVPGYEGRCNDVVYCSPTHRVETYTTVVYFGGDMQDFTENMRTHRESKNYLKWNLEDTARVLHSNFADSHIVVIRPARIEYKTFSCFKNFVPCNNCGSPEHTPMHYALQHLEKLLQNISERLRTMSLEEINTAISIAKSSHVQDETKIEEQSLQKPQDSMLTTNLWWRENLNLDKNNLVLIGFSKGCVVLNQFLYEFHYLKTLTPDDHSSMDVVSRIKDMYWLDGGHSGGKNTWITSRPLLETLTRLGINIHIHVSPYQIQDDRRPCIRKEEKLFSDLLRRLGASLNRTVHFENMFPNLYMHFDIINVFRLINVHHATQCSDGSK